MFDGSPGHAGGLRFERKGCAAARCQRTDADAIEYEGEEACLGGNAPSPRIRCPTNTPPSSRQRSNYRTTVSGIVRVVPQCVATTR